MSQWTCNDFHNSIIFIGHILHKIFHVWLGDWQYIKYKYKVSILKARVAMPHISVIIFLRINFTNHALTPLTLNQTFLTDSFPTILTLIKGVLFTITNITNALVL